MKFRWTMKELKEFTDDEILKRLIAERTSTLNPYAPLAKRLNKIYFKLAIRIEKQISK